MTGRLVWYGVASFCNLYRLATTTEDTQASCAAAFRIFGGSHRVSCDHDVKDETTSVYDASPPLLFLGKPCHEFGRGAKYRTSRMDRRAPQHVPEQTLSLLGRRGRKSQ